MRFIGISRLTLIVIALRSDYSCLGPRKGRLMKKLIFVLLSVVLFVPVSALGQDTAKPSAPDRDSSHNQPALSKPANISGKVGEDGKTFTSSKNYLLLVTNPELLKDFVGQLVKVKCQFSRVRDTNEI